MAKKKVDEDKYIRQNVSMEPEQHKRLMEVCQSEDRTISWVIRQALDLYIDAHQCTPMRN